MSLSGMLQGTGSMSAGATFRALASLPRLRPITGARACSPGISDEGHYGDVALDGLSVIAVAEFEGNIWAGETKATMGLFFDEQADERQREALQMVFGGQAGGSPQASPS